MGGGGGGGFFKGTKGGKPRRQHGNTPMNNYTQNSQTDDVARKLKLTKHQAQELHMEITKQGYGYQEILEIAKNMFGK